MINERLWSVVWVLLLVLLRPSVRPFVCLCACMPQWRTHKRVCILIMNIRIQILWVYCVQRDARMHDRRDMENAWIWLSYTFFSWMNLLGCHFHCSIRYSIHSCRWCCFSWVTTSSSPWYCRRFFKLKFIAHSIQSFVSRLIAVQCEFLC